MKIGRRLQDRHQFRGNHVGRRRCKLQATPSAISFKPMHHMKVLFEMVPERKIQKWRPGSSELHAGRQASLYEGNITGGEVAIEVRNEGAHLDARQLRNRGGIN